MASERGAGARAGRARPGDDASAVAYCDGASRGNPGPAAYGVRILAADGTELFAEGRAIGRATNNVAEYRAAIAALEKARELGIERLELRLDSELVVRQLTGSYRVKAPGLAPLKERVEQLAGGLSRFRVRHVRREENREADRLANAALDARAARGTLDRRAGNW